MVRITRTTQSTKKNAALPKDGVRDFVTSLDPAQTTPQRFYEIIRSHWSVENKNHWKRDAQWVEDTPRHHSCHTAQVLAILRGALLALVREPCPTLFARCHKNPFAALRLLSAPLTAN